MTCEFSIFLYHNWYTIILRKVKMLAIHAEVTEVLDAAPQAVYAVLADYQKAHPAILPKPYFEELVVEQGGQGAGTIFRLRMKVMGTEKNYRQVVSEPVTGQVLVETDPEQQVTTTFTVQPEPGGSGTRLTIATTTPASKGVAGWMERQIAPLVLRRIYQKEIQLLRAYLE